MSGINMTSIMGKVQQFAKSPEGKERMKRCIEKYRREGRTVTYGGGIIINKEIMCRVAETLISMLQETASQKQLPESVRRHFDSLYYTDPVPQDKDAKTYKCTITFGDDLSRMSLVITSGSRKGERTGGGIKDIVALFDTGYDASGSVYGQWDNHGGDNVKSLSHRDGLHFLQETVDSFNREYGALYGAYAYVAY